MSPRIKMPYKEGPTHTNSRPCGNVENSASAASEKEAADAAPLTKTTPNEAENALSRPPNLREQLEERRKRSRQEVLAELGLVVQPHSSGMWRPVVLKKPPRE